MHLVNMEHLKWYHAPESGDAKDILFTHAGVSNTWLPKYIPRNVNSIVAFLENCSRDKLFEVGRARGGFYKCGGPLWCDFHEEFMYIEGVTQIFGHSAFRPDPNAQGPIAIEWSINIDNLDTSSTILRIAKGEIGILDLNLEKN